MKWMLLPALLLSFSSFAQLKDYKLSVRGDTLNRVDMKDRRQGPWVLRVENLRGERGYEEEGYYVNNLKEGTWKRFSLEGVKIAEENYRWGKLNGKSRYFTYNGGLLREESWRAIDPANPYDTVAVYDVNDPSKIVQRVVVKNEGSSVKHGTWTFYDPTQGVVIATENYVLNKPANTDGTLVSADDDMKPIDIRGAKAASDTAGKKPATKPQAIMDYEKKNSGKKKVKTREGSTGL